MTTSAVNFGRDPKDSPKALDDLGEGEPAMQHCEMPYRMLIFLVEKDTSDCVQECSLRESLHELAHFGAFTTRTNDLCSFIMRYPKLTQVLARDESIQSIQTLKA
jgi:hypothetical protein